jgi:N-acyl-L-homoserine lactone synthetase
MAIVERGIRGHGDSDVLRAMFVARKRVFVDLLGWNVPVLDGKFEIDQFDDPRATYVIVSGESGDHRASARLLQTTGPHILGDLFPKLCEREVPTGPDVLEITRFCLDRSLSASTRLQARNRLVSALVAFALRSGVRTYTGVAELAWLQQILAFGWDCRPLGAPRLVDGRWLGALAIAIAPETPALLAGNRIWIDEQLDQPALSQAA